ncbi:MAG: zf-HC2 domain-containing protein [Ignavibacteriales bacterium]|nr:zf-HC2 domain-containing protein [Ignavibacteriales bacterium]
MSNERINHPEFQHMLPDYLTQSLDEEQRDKLEQHLEVCADCRATVESLKRLFGKLASRAPAVPPVNYFSTVLPRIRVRLQFSKRPSILSRLFPVRRALDSSIQLLVDRWLAPIVTVVITVVLVSHIELGESESGNGLRSVVNSLTADELAEVFVGQAQEESLTSLGVVDVFSADVLNQAEAQELFGAILDDETIDEYVPLQGFPELNEREVETLLQRLKERTML